MSKENQPIDTSLELYRKMMEMADDYDYGITNSNGMINWDDDDCETVFTSEDIVKNKKLLENVGNKSNTSNNDGIIEEEVYYKRYRTQKKKNYTDSEMKAIEEGCIGTFVHDYGESDWYHVSDEERDASDQLKEISDRLAGVRSTYSRVDQYISAMRIVFEAWGILAKMNFIHTEDEFFKMVAEGRIVSSRIPTPRLRKMDQYNMDMIINLISNPNLDISHLAPINKNNDLNNKNWLMDEDDEEYETADDERDRLLSLDEKIILVESALNPENIEKMEISDIPRKYIKGYENRRTSFRKKKKKKKGNKTERYITNNLHTLLNKIQDSKHYQDYTNSYIVTHALFDQEKPPKSFWDDVYFDGSWENDDEVAILDLVLQEELMKQRPIKQRHVTYADLDVNRFFETLESEGVNTVYLRQQMNCTTEDQDKRILSITKKENKAKEKALLNRIIKLNNNKKFKKISEKAENELNKLQREEEIPGL